MARHSGPWRAFGFGCAECAGAYSVRRCTNLLDDPHSASGLHELVLTKKQVMVSPSGHCVSWDDSIP